MSPLKTNPFQENNTCPGIQENSIIPILLSSLSTTELCLMFLIERDKADQNIYYRSRNCDKVLQNGLFCPSCQELFDNLNHFHHIQLKKSCKQFQEENVIITEPKQEHEPINPGCESLSLEPFDEENSVDLHLHKLEDTQEIIVNQNDITIQDTESDQMHSPEIGKIKKKYYTCKHCKIFFLSKHQRSEHIKMSHSYKVKERKQKWEDKVKNDIRMQCPFCLDLKLKYSISKHLLEMHYSEKDNPIYQDIMKKSFENNDDDLFRVWQRFLDPTSLLSSFIQVVQRCFWKRLSV